jgi:diguanylate cyclase (GGDEF)-like protein
VISREQAERMKTELLELLAEDAHNAERLASRLDALTRERGVDAHAALLMVLCRLRFPEDEAREHWEAIVRHRDALSRALQRNVAIRVALLDYFVHVNRRLVQPTLIGLEMLESIERTAGIDPTTGLANERTFRATVQTELRRVRRFKGAVSVVLFDLDDFDRVNRAAGELVGDRILNELGILLKNKSRDIDLAARPAEDEFALVLPETPRNGALMVAERYRLEVERYFLRREVGGGVLGITVSGGIATFPADADAPEDLLSRAAEALYRAKADGRNRVVAWTPERRRFLRFDLEPGRFEVEVLGGPTEGGGDVVNVSRDGIVFRSPEPLHVGERIEIRLLESSAARGVPGLRVRGRVVRLEALPSDDRDAGAGERYEVGVTLDADAAAGDGLIDFLERAHADLRRSESG